MPSGPSRSCASRFSGSPWRARPAPRRRRGCPVPSAYRIGPEVARRFNGTLWLDLCLENTIPAWARLAAARHARARARVTRTKAHRDVDDAALARAAAHLHDKGAFFDARGAVDLCAARTGAAASAGGRQARSASRHAADLHAIDARLLDGVMRTRRGVLRRNVVRVVKQTLEAHARSRRWLERAAGADNRAGRRRLRAKDQSAKSRCSVRSGPATANSDLSTS